MREHITNQLKTESLAFVGLLIALIALGYNTWRNELSEQNQTVRLAGFEMLLKVGELQNILYSNATLDNMPAETAKYGEIAVLGLRDFSMFMPAEVKAKSLALVSEWRRQLQVLYVPTTPADKELSLALVDTKLNELRLEIVKVVKALE